jgi:anti-sigma-K factor RskA
MTPLPPDDSALAAELVLGLLSPAEEAQARARVATDAAFAADVAAWEEQLLPLLVGPDAQPRAQVWERVKAGITITTGQDNGAKLRFWRGFSMASSAAALLLGVALLNQPSPVTVAPSAPLVAALGSETGTAALAASYDPAQGMLTTLPVKMDMGPMHPELWIIPVGGTATSLGMIDPAKPIKIILSPEQRRLIAMGATLAITPEPAGGAPGGKATGPVVASGTITTI